MASKKKPRKIKPKTKKNKKVKRRVSRRTARAKLPRASGAKGTKTAAQLLVLQRKFAMSLNAGDEQGCCYFKDPSGGPDQGVPSTKADCKDAGGSWSPGNCRN